MIGHPNKQSKALAGEFLFLVGMGVAQRRHGFEGELGIDDQGPRIRQENDAVRPRPVRQCVLKFVRALGQAILDDRLHAGLTEGANIEKFNLDGTPMNQ